MKAVWVEALDNYRLQVKFDDGVSGSIDLGGFVDTGIFSVLKNKEMFDKVYTNGYSVAWNDELEIDSLNIYAELLNKKPEEILANNLSYATN